VHLHWHIVNFISCSKDIYSQIDIDKIWNETEPIQLGALECRTFSCRYNLLYLCLHAFMHSFYPLLLLCDINVLVSAHQGQIDWELFVEEAVRFGLSKPVYYALYFSSEILGAQIPENALSKLRPKKMSMFEREFATSKLGGNSDVYGNALFYLGMNETLKERIAFVYKALFPSRAELALLTQKDIAQVSIFDYIRRLNISVNTAAGVVFKKLQ
jgi:hypothetical protein